MGIAADARKSRAAAKAKTAPKLVIPGAPESQIRGLTPHEKIIQQARDTLDQVTSHTGSALKNSALNIANLFLPKKAEIALGTNKQEVPTVNGKPADKARGFLQKTGAIVGDVAGSLPGLAATGGAAGEVLGVGEAAHPLVKAASNILAHAASFSATSQNRVQGAVTGGLFGGAGSIPGTSAIARVARYGAQPVIAGATTKAFGGTNEEALTNAGVAGVLGLPGLKGGAQPAEAPVKQEAQVPAEAQPLNPLELTPGMASSTESSGGGRGKQPTVPEVQAEITPAEAPGKSAGLPEKITAVKDEIAAKLRSSTVGTLGSEARDIASPASASEKAGYAANVIREAKSKIETVNVREKLIGKAAEKHFESLPEDPNGTNISHYEKTGQFKDAPAGYSEFYKKSLDTSREILQQVYGNDRVGYVENYVRRMFKFGDPKEEAKAVASLSQGGNRSLSASKSPLKQRTLDMPLDQALATMRAQGIKVEPLTTNPELLRQWSVVNAESALAYKKAWDQAKASGLVSFFRPGEKPPEDFVKLNDKVATVFHPAKATFREFFDKRVMDDLNNVAAELGIKHERSLGHRGFSGGTAGLSYQGADLIKTRAGSPESVLAHEIGHQIDHKYGLQEKLVNNPKTKVELRKLADLRTGGEPSSAYFQSYIRSAPEKMAVMMEALIHMPDQFKKVAPNTYKMFTDILKSDPKLAPILDIHNSLKLGSEVYTKDMGLSLGGQFYASPDVARIFNNTVSTGLENSSIYKAIRDVNNNVNMFNLGLSAFHATGEAINASISDIGLGLDKIRPKNLKLQGMDVVGGAKNIARGAVPGLSFAHDVSLGRTILKGLKNGDPEVAKIVEERMNPAGARFRVEQNLRTDAYKKMTEAWKNGGLLGKASTPFRVPGVVIEAVAKPLMEYAIPRAKVGAFLDLAEQEMRKLPANATDAVRRKTLAAAWDSIDNRFGQLVYDNLFWTKTQKDLALIATRSVGWNLGTVRELGGAATDVAQGKISPRVLYAATLPIYVGMVGAAYQYLHTKKLPKTLLDYYYPQNGLTTSSGDPDRVQLPTYMKDVYAYSQHPFTTIANKTSPILSMTYQLARNRNYFGDMIRNPDDPASKQLQQTGAYLLQGTAPFSVQNLMKLNEEGGTPLQKVEGFFGFSKASAETTNSKFVTDVFNRYSAQLNQGARTPEQQAIAKQKSDVRQQVKAGDKSGVAGLVQQGVLTQKGAKQFTTAAEKTSLQRAFEGLSVQTKLQLLQEAKPTDLSKLDTDAILAEMRKYITNTNTSDANKATGKLVIQQLLK